MTAIQIQSGAEVEVAERQSELVARLAVLVVGHGAEPEPVGGHGPPLGFQLCARHVIGEIKRLAGLRSAPVTAHHARDYARYHKESRPVFQGKA
jgi:hypothetical protein